MIERAILAAIICVVVLAAVVPLGEALNGVLRHAAAGVAGPSLTVTDDGRHH